MNDDEEAPMAGKKRGPAKEKRQITIRVDKKLMDEVNAQLRDDKMRLTDMIERALILALAERGVRPVFTKQLRFALADAPRDAVEAVRGLAIAMQEDALGIKRSPVDELIWEFVQRFLKLANDSPNAEKCLEFYSRYAPPAKEIRKLV